MRYRYKPTGAVIEIASVLTSPEWEKVGTLAPEAKPDNPKKPGKKAVKADDKLR